MPDPLVDLIRSVAEADMARRSRRPRFGTLAADDAVTRRLAPKPPVKPCPRCRGEGKFNSSLSTPADPQLETDCALCRGDGEVPRDTAA